MLEARDHDGLDALLDAMAPLGVGAIAVCATAWPTLVRHTSTVVAKNSALMQMEQCMTFTFVGVEASLVREAYGNGRCGGNLVTGHSG